MNQSENNEPSREERLNELIADYLRRTDQGEHVDAEEMVAGQPDLADSFHQYLADVALMDEARRSSASREEVAAKEETAKTEANQETMPPSGVRGATGDEPESKQFGRYKIVRKIGAGGMGSVYLAEDPGLERRVALKIPTIHEKDDSQSLQRFYQEARLAATVSHPNICPVHDIGEQDGTPFIAMAYVHGQPLSRLVGSRKLRSQKVIATLVRKIALALAEAHGQGVIHRDMKPGNILIDKRGEPIVTDFGLAHRETKADEERLTQSGAILGTPAYMAPEQVEGKLDQIGPRCDIYSLGVILYELLTGQCPFSGPVAVILTQILRDQPKPPTDLVPDIDKRLESTCLKMMAKKPQDRHRSAKEVADELKRLLLEVASSDSIASGADSAAGKYVVEKQRITELLRAGEYAEAAAALKQMMELRDASAEQYAAWAKEESKRLRAIPAEVRAVGPQIVETALDMMTSQQYAEAAGLLGAVPEEYRSKEAATLLEKATRLEQEAKELNTRVAGAVLEHRYDGLRPVLERLLELEPGNLVARELYENLSTYNPGQPYRFDKQGHLLSAQRDSVLTLADRFLKKMLRDWTQRQKYAKSATGKTQRPMESTAEGPSGPSLLNPLLVLGFGGLGFLLMAIVFFIGDGRHKIRVEIDEHLLADSSVTFLIDDEQMEISGLGAPIRLKPGPHGYELRRGDEIIRSGNFTVVKGDNPVLEITLAEDAGHVTRDASLTARAPAITSRNAESLGNDSVPSQTPHLAIAPFDATEAKRHQQAWADYLGVPVETTNSIGMKMVLIPPGEFMMGSDGPAIRAKGKASPRHQVRITRPFYFGKYEVTQREVMEILGAKPWVGAEKWNGGYKMRDGPNVAAGNVSWNEMKELCTKLGEQEGEKYRLPTEAEWEYACRAGTTTLYHFGNDKSQLQDYAWYDRNSGLDFDSVEESGPFPLDVGQKRPNAWGLHDMLGNLCERCSDWLDDEYYGRSPVDNPQGPSEQVSDQTRVMRGSSWGSNATWLQVERRDSTRELHGYDRIGYRVVREIKGP